MALYALLEPGPVAAFIARPMPRSPRKRLVRVEAICQRRFETMSERAIDEALTERGLAWAADDEKDAKRYLRRIGSPPLCKLTHWVTWMFIQAE